MLKLNQRLQHQGIDEGTADAICLDFDLGAAYYGRWAESRVKATKEVPDNRSKRRKPMKQVPKYKTLAAALGITESEGRAESVSQEEVNEIDEMVDKLRRDPAALIEFLKLNGEG